MRALHRSVSLRAVITGTVLLASWSGLPASDLGVSAQTAPPAAAPVPAAAPAAAPSFRDGTILNQGRKVHYLDWGTAGKPVFIMLHALGKSAHSYDHIAPLLTDDYRVIAMDMRGHGDSDWSPTGAYKTEDFVEDLHALITQLGLRDVALTGCSMGGRVVQVYAGMHPDRVSKVIVQDVGFARPESTTTTLTSRIAREQEGWASADELFTSLRQNPTRVAEDVHRRQVQWETRRLANGRIGWKYDPNVVQGLGPVNLWSYVQNIKAPALYVVGGRSRLVTADEQSKLRQLPTVDVVTIPDAGHYPHEDTPELFLAVVRAFLAG